MEILFQHFASLPLICKTFLPFKLLSSLNEWRAGAEQALSGDAPVPTTLCVLRRYFQLCWPIKYVDNVLKLNCRDVLVGKFRGKILSKEEKGPGKKKAIVFRSDKRTECA